MKVLMVSDSGVPTGYGRIADEVGVRLHRRGVSIMAASLAYDGLLPPQMNGSPLPYWVASLAGRNWVEETVKLIGVYQPDVVLVIQDAPYAEALRHAPVDWSRHAFAIVTPVDGAPVYPRWVGLLREADAALTISQFGFDTYRAAGVRVGLCRPGVDPAQFYRLTDEARADLRAKLGIAPGAFVLGSMCMNQGRKAIPAMLEGFFNFAQDKPDARYVLDMDATSPAGWDIPALCQQFGWDTSKLIFRADALRAGLTDLRDRYNLLDAHTVLSHREGYGLPLAEAMACGAVSIALDYCSGREICGDGRGVLVKPLAQTSVSTWGGARDCHPDAADFAAALERLYCDPAERARIAACGREASRAWTWDAAADAVYTAIATVGTRHAVSEYD